jgi:hypothetical protein
MRRTVISITPAGVTIDGARVTGMRDCRRSSRPHDPAFRKVSQTIIGPDENRAANCSVWRDDKWRHAREDEEM